MLVLRRKVGERIVLGHDVVVTIASASVRAVRLAIQAPPGVSILRGEVHDAIVAANEAAAQCEDSMPPSQPWPHKEEESVDTP